MNLSRGEMLEVEVGFVGEASDMFLSDAAVRLEGVSNALDMFGDGRGCVGDVFGNEEVGAVVVAAGEGKGSNSFGLYRGTDVSTEDDVSC